MANLEKRLSGGDKALIGNAGHRRDQRRAGAGRAFEIDAGKLAEEARFDGIFVLRTNARMTPLNAILRFRELLLVEDLFRRAKVQLPTRPIYHSCDAAVRGHVFCSFLALVLQKELADLCRINEIFGTALLKAGLNPGEDLMEHGFGYPGMTVCPTNAEGWRGYGHAVSAGCP